VNTRKPLPRRARGTGSGTVLRLPVSISVPLVELSCTGFICSVTSKVPFGVMKVWVVELNNMVELPKEPERSASKVPVVEAGDVKLREKSAPNVFPEPLPDVERVKVPRSITPDGSGALDPLVKVIVSLPAMSL
jgi:hypothetical protein